MKNYYEILEVSQNASPEVIEKAYKTLVKKYHPDLQPQEEKANSENKIKEINEAYEILSDKLKKEKYDIELNQRKMQEEKAKYSNVQNNNNINSTSSNNEYNSNNYVVKKKVEPQNDYNSYNLQNEYNKAINEAYNNAYHNAYNQAYINTLKNMGYKIHYQKTLKERIRIFFSVLFAIIVLVIISFILWQIPPIKKYFIELYRENEFIKFFVDIIFNIIKSFLSLFHSK